MTDWTTPADIAARVRRRWNDGTLLRDRAAATPFASVEIALRGPRPAQIGDDIAAARSWVADLDAGRCDDTRYRLVWQDIGGRLVGRNRLPVRAVVSTAEQAWALLGVAAAVRRFDQLLESAGDRPAVRDWIVAQPHRALELAAEFPQLLAAHDWLDANRGSGSYLRQISAPGVDTKFAERHRPALAGMLGVPGAPAGFLAELGLRAKPTLLRLRPSPTLGLPTPLTELAVRPEELSRLDIRPRTAVIVENEISYFSVDVPVDGVVLWGKGFGVDAAGRLPWLAGADVVYWGDVDTHGFAILDRLRAWLPQARSVLMDHETLLAHRDRWVAEDRPTTAELTRLSAGERELYEMLVEDRLGERVRLEQERIDWGWVQQRLPRAAPITPPAAP